jgi:hypothetical protein
METKVNVCSDPEDGTKSLAVRRTWPADLSALVAGEGAGVEEDPLATCVPDVLVDGLRELGSSHVASAA